MYGGFGFGYGLPKAVKSLLIINVAVFIVTTFVSFPWNWLFGLVPSYINHKFWLWQFFTYMFLHGGVSHIFFNMLGLWMFGSEIEYNWGTRDFLKYYFTCGIGGGILVWLMAMAGLTGMNVPTIGASGAIFGILVAFGMMWPDRLIYLFGIIPIKALHFVIIFGAIDLFDGLAGTAKNIAVFAHVGGGVTGFLYLKFGWRIMIYIESISARFRMRKFKVIEKPKKQETYILPDDDEKEEEFRDDALEDEVDRILDKIAREGMGSITDHERKILDRASNKRKTR